MIRRLLRIDWTGPLTMGRPVFAHSIDGAGHFIGINHTSGFRVGWDRWSDGRGDTAVTAGPA